MKPSRLLRAGLPLAATLLWSCSLLSVEQIAVTSFPCGRNQIISREDRITLAFSITPDRVAAERLARVTSPDGPCSLDYRWDAGVLQLVPVPALPAGERIVLSMSGSLPAADGRQFTVALEVPFFVETDEPPPRLASFSPADGAPADHGATLQFEFTRPMDTESFAAGFLLSPAAAHEVSWSADRRTVTVAPKDRWENLTLYSWEIAGTVRDEQGVRLAVSSSGCFSTQVDAAPPSIVSVHPATANGDGTFTVFDVPLNGNLGARDCVCLSFSEDLAVESLRSAFRLDPPVSGRLVRESAGTCFFMPEEPYLMGADHHLTISTDLEDLAGNRMAREHSEWFVPDIPVQQVLSVEANGGPAVTVNAPTPIDVTLTVEAEVAFVVTLAQPCEGQCRAEIPFAVGCEAVFPSSILSPTLRSAAWTTGLSLTLIYTGFSPSAGSELHHYRLSFPRGQDGIANGDGSFLEEDAWLVLVAR